MEPVAVALTIIFKSPSALNGAAAFLGLVDSVEGRLTRLMASEYEVGLRHLREIGDAPESEQFLLREAWKRFAKAISIEQGERKALSYIGLSFAQYHLAERDVAISTLKELLELDFVDKPERLHRKVVMGTAVMYSLLFGGFISIGVLAVASYHFLNNDNDSALRTFESPYVALEKFLKIMQTIPSEERVAALKDQVAAFLRNEGSLPNQNM
jgi:tetratricopeptide (TPR) repeat protein